MDERSKVISIALNEVGYLEKKSNSQLDDKTANAGSGNYTKYARDLHKLGDFYNGNKNGFSWCDVFVDWCFVTAFGEGRALELLCQPKKSCGAGVGFSCDYYKNKGQFYTKAQIGDQIFFKNSKGVRTHTGLVYQVDNNYVYTVEGNTGDGVRQKKYAINSSSIYGYGRPKYKVESQPVPCVAPVPVKKGYSGTFPKLPYVKYKNSKGKICYRTWFIKGDRGQQVKYLQMLLNWANGDKLDVDGIIGKHTIASVEKFQQNNGLVVDKLFGKNSLAKAKSITK